MIVHTNQTFSLWNTLEPSAAPRHALPYTNTTIAAVAPGGRRAAFASGRGELTLWDASDQFQPFARPETNWINRLIFSPDGRRLAMSARRSIRVFDVATRTQTHAFATGGTVMSLAYSADGQSLLAGFFGGAVTLYSLSASAPEKDFLGHEQQVRGLALSPDGQTLVSTSVDATIRFWNVLERQRPLILSPREAGFYACALSPDGHRLAVGGSDGLVTILDANLLEEVTTLKGHTDSVGHLAFTPDGNTLVSVSENELRVWRGAPENRASGSKDQMRTAKREKETLQ